MTHDAFVPSIDVPAGIADAHPRRWLMLAVLVLGLLLIAIDATVLNLALPAVAADLQPSATQLLWIVDVYSLVLAGLLVTAGTLGDRLGRKRLLLAGVTVFGVASLVAAFAPNVETLIGARVLLGIGGALMMPSTLSIVRNVFSDPRERTLAIGIWSAVAGAGAAVGPIAGGVLLEYFRWGTVFLINVPVMLLLIVFGARLLPESRDPHPGRWDAPSALLSIVGMVAVVYGVKELGTYGFADVRGLIAGGLGLLFLTVFVRRQLRLDEPLLDVRLFRNRVFATAVSCNLLTLFGLSGMLFFVSLLFQYVQGHSPLAAGIRMLPLTLAAAVAAVLVGRVTSRVGVRVPLAGGVLLIGVSLLALGFAAPSGEYLVIALALIGVGAGAGLALTASSDTIISSVAPEKAGGAAAISETGYELGTALGVAVLGTVMNAIYRDAIDAVPGIAPGVSGLARESLPSAAQVVAELPADLGAALLVAARQAFLDGLQATTAIGATVMIVVSLAAWLLLRSPSARTPTGPVRLDAVRSE